MGRAVKFSLGAILALILALGLVVGGAYWWMLGSLPRLDGTLALAGLGAPVEVLRDRDGIVTIRAESERDAAFALGYAHAQDRLWQMDFMRRTGAGRLSEVAGARTLRLDQFMRTLGLYRTAQANVEHLSPPVRALLDAYAAGVNAVIQDEDATLPIEFQIMRYRPEPWRPADSLIWARLMSLQLSGNWSEELLRARIIRRLGPARAADLWPTYPADGPVTLPDLAGALDGLALERFATLLPWSLAPKFASNSWVLSGAGTSTGAPILANDPHLTLEAPGIWYLARIETPGHTFTGVTAPGLPIPVLGQNGTIAWGFTTTQSDTQDLFMERTRPGEPGLYVTPDGPRPFETREEIIEVRGAEPERWTVRATRHGPVISDAIAGDNPAAPEGTAPGSRPGSKTGSKPGSKTVLALAWPGLRTDDRSVEAVYWMGRARTWDEFRAATRMFHSPQQNIVYADRAGHIGFIAPARVPIRKRGNGQVPVPGWSGDYDWIGEIPFAGLPTAFDPPGGRIVAANNKIVPDDYPYLLTARWADFYRARRIEALLDDVGAGPTYSPDNARVMQQDIVSLAARDLLPYLLRTKPTNDRARAALDILGAWDGSMDRNSPAPLLFYAWVRALNQALLADELGPDFVDFQRPRIDRLVYILSARPAWCDVVGTEPTESCAEIIGAALDIALDDLDARFGGAPGELRWGAAHMARFRHPLLDRVPLLGRAFSYAVEAGGGSYTLNRGGVSFGGRSTEVFEDIHGAGYRAVYDLADPENSRFMIATGQSGNPFSPYYGNLATRWRDGAYFKLGPGGPPPAHRLLLTPAPGPTVQQD